MRNPGTSPVVVDAVVSGCAAIILLLLVALACAWRRVQSLRRQAEMQARGAKLHEGVVSHKHEPYDEELSAYGSGGSYGSGCGGGGSGGGGGGGGGSGAGFARKSKKQRAKKGAADVEMSTAIVPVRNSDDDDEEEEEEGDDAAMAAADALLASIASRASGGDSGGGSGRGSGGGSRGGSGRESGRDAKKAAEGGEGNAADDPPYEIYDADGDSVAVVPQGRPITRGEAVSGKHGPLRKGDQVWYNSRSLGPIPAKIVGIDSRGAFDGGETYLIESPHLDGDAIETVRERLSRVKPVQ